MIWLDSIENEEGSGKYADRDIQFFISSLGKLMCNVIIYHWHTSICIPYAVPLDSYPCIIDELCF